MQLKIEALEASTVRSMCMGSIKMVLSPNPKKLFEFMPARTCIRRATTKLFV